MKWDCRNRIKTSTSRLPIPYTNPKKFYLLDHFEHINIKENWKSIWILDPYGKLSQTNMDPLALKNCNKSYLRGGKKLCPFSRKKNYLCLLVHILVDFCEKGEFLNSKVLGTLDLGNKLLNTEQLVSYSICTATQPSK